MIKQLGVMAIMVSFLALAGCSSSNSTVKKEDYSEENAANIYDQALTLFDDDKFLPAAKKFDEVEHTYPYSIWAKKAQLMSGYIYYISGEYVDSILVLDRFQDLYPNDDEIAYIHYLKALNYYDQITTVDRDQDITYEALQQFNIVINQYPNSEYVQDASLKRDLALNHLAGKEMEVGRFYLKREDYAAAINRFRIVVEQFQQTSHIKEALARLTEIYLALGVIGEARKNADILAYNFPETSWNNHAQALLKKYNVSLKASNS